MKTKWLKEWNEGASRWEYTVTDGITVAGMWSTEELSVKMEKYTYSKLEDVLNEEYENSGKH
jgi:hypothetical protein